MASKLRLIQAITNNSNCMIWRPRVGLRMILQSDDCFGGIAPATVNPCLRAPNSAHHAGKRLMMHPHFALLVGLRWESHQSRIIKNSQTAWAFSSDIGIEALRDVFSTELGFFWIYPMALTSLFPYLLQRTDLGVCVNGREWIAHHQLMSKRYSRFST